MKLRYSDHPIPRNWSALPGMTDRIVLEQDLAINAGKLRAKLLVFKNCLALRQFWSAVLQRGNLGRGCRGAVNSLVSHTAFYEKGSDQPTNECLVVDPRYFCVIGLVVGYVSAEIITHESVHAAFAFAKRKSRSPWDALAADFDEEALCYPAGRIAQRIIDTLYNNKLIKK